MPSVNRIDLQALTLAGPTVTRTVPDTLAVLSLNNRVYIYDISTYPFVSSPTVVQSA